MGFWDKVDRTEVRNLKFDVRTKKKKNARRTPTERAHGSRMTGHQDRMEKGVERPRRVRRKKKRGKENWASWGAGPCARLGKVNELKIFFSGLDPVGKGSKGRTPRKKRPSLQTRNV